MKHIFAVIFVLVHALCYTLFGWIWDWSDWKDWIGDLFKPL